MSTSVLPIKICKNCSGAGWHKSNISRTHIKCRVCKGTGNVPTSLVINPEVQKKWIELDSTKKEEVFQHLKIEPNIILKSPWRRLFSLPIVWWKHYLISRKTLSFFKSIKFSTLWTFITIYPTFALKIIKRKLKL
jgi:hypothetical protein